MTSDIGAAAAVRILGGGGGGSGASQILSASQKKPGQFTPKTGAATDIRATLDQVGADAQRKQLINSALLRLRGIAEGVIDPQAEWETTAGFLQLTGQAFQLGVGEDGAPKVTPQTATSPLEGYTPGQEARIREAATRLESLVEQVDLEDTKAEMRAKLAFGILRIEEMKNFSPAEAFWEQQFQRTKERGEPVKLALDADGEVIALDQLDHDFSDVEDPEDRQTLLDARRQLENILNGDATPTEAWQFEALGNAAEGDDYFLALDEDGAVSVERNKITTVTPEFLEPDPDGPDTQAAWEEKALELYQQKKSFHFEFGPDGELEVVENTFLNVTQDLDPSNGADGVRNALVSLLA